MTVQPPTTNYPDVAPPADATMVDELDRVFDREAPHRFFSGTLRGEKVRVGINGFQNAHGSVRQRWISVAGQELDAAAAQEGAYDLLAATDELEQMNGQDPAVAR